MKEDKTCKNFSPATYATCSSCTIDGKYTSCSGNKEKCKNLCTLRIMTQLYKKNGAVFIPAGITVEEVENLKDDNKVMADNYSKMEQKFYDNFTKANKLIDELSSSLSVVGECGEEECELLNRAEQFLKDSIE